LFLWQISQPFEGDLLDEELDPVEMGFGGAGRVETLEVAEF